MAKGETDPACVLVLLPHDDAEHGAPAHLCLQCVNAQPELRCQDRRVMVTSPSLTHIGWASRGSFHGLVALCAGSKWTQSSAISLGASVACVRISLIVSGHFTGW
jgi:hypothetical protein